MQAAHGHAAPAPARLVLLDPAPISRTWLGEFEAEFARRQPGVWVRAQRAELATSGLRERDPSAWPQRTFEVSVAGYLADPQAARSRTPFRVSGRVQQSIWDSLGDFDLAGALRDVRCPALVVHGRDGPVPLDSSRAAAAALHAELVVLDACGHVPYVEQPQALFGAVRSFLGRTSPHPRMTA